MNSVYAWTPSWIEISEAIVSVFVESINQTIHVYLSIFYTIKFSIKSAAEFNRILKELIFIITIISLSTYNWSFIVSIVCRNSCGVKYRSTKQLAHTTGNVVINLELKKKKKCISYSRFNKNNSHDSLPMITNRFISLFCESTSIWHSHEFGQFLYKQINFFFIKVLSFDILNDFFISKRFFPDISPTSATSWSMKLSRKPSSVSLSSSSFSMAFVFRGLVDSTWGERVMFAKSCKR